MITDRIGLHSVLLPLLIEKYQGDAAVKQNSAISVFIYIVKKWAWYCAHRRLGRGEKAGQRP